MRDLNNRVAFITGGASGIGLGIARAFVDAGMNVVIASRSSVHVQEAQAVLADAAARILILQVDVTDRQALESAADITAEQFGAIHVLVNNAGVQVPAKLGDTSLEDWDRLIEVNVTGVFNGIQVFLPRIRSHDEGGHILTTASVVGLVVPHEGYTAYYTSKYATMGLMEGLRAELQGSNIGVSILCPGPVRSNLEVVLRDHPLGSDPFEIGRLALEGMQRNDLYILTHPEYAPLLRLRQQALEAAIAKAPRPKEALATVLDSLVPNAIYADHSDIT